MTRCHPPFPAGVVRATVCTAALVLACLAPPAWALDTLEFRIGGADDALADRLRGASLLTQAQAEGRTAPEDLLSTARADYRTLTGVLYGAGHYGGTVSIRVNGVEAQALSPLSSPARIDRIDVIVEAGRTFTFDTAQVAPVAPQTTLPEGFAPGQVARAAVIGDAAQAAVAGWRDAGHAKAGLADQTVTADHANTRLSARIAIDPGPRLRFAAPTVSGQNRVRPERIREIAGLPVGETFSPQAMETSAARLRRAGAFRSVALREGDAAGDTLPVDIAVVEAPRRRLGYGAELSSLDGLSLTGFWMHRNLLGGAERLRVEFALEQIGGEGTSGDPGADFELSARYQRPATFTPDTDLYFGGSVHRIDDPNFLSRGLSLSGGVQHIFSDRLTGGLGLAYSASRIEDALGERDFVLLSAPASLRWDGRDTPLDATSGIYADLSLMPFLAVSGTDNGVQLKLDTRAYQAFGADERFVLAGRLQLGVLAGPTLERAPSDMLFYAGGGGSVRGHAFQSLGVPLAAGSGTTGGRSLLALSGELRADITDSIGLVAFADTGFVGPDSFPGDGGDWITGAGLGARYATPIGPIRLDIAVPVSGGDDDGGVQIYIGIGQAF